MKDEKEQTWDAIAKSWLACWEQAARQRDYDTAQAMLHKHCVYFGLRFDAAPRDLREMFPEHLRFSFDMAQTKFVIEGNATVIISTWVAHGLIAGSPQKTGRATFVLMRFTGDKFLAVHAHWSRMP